MVNKITSAITPNETADKINEIIDDKQDVLVSGTNIKTINSESILGSGDIIISGSSLPSQTGNAGKFLTTDGTDASWASISQRNIGEIVTSTLPLTDAGLHLLDGALISGSGIYADFVTYIAGLVSTYPDLFETEANWQSAVTTYGVCGKFVYDSVNNTVRLPKYSNKIYTSDIKSTAPVVGNGMALGITDGTTNFGGYTNREGTQSHARLSAITGAYGLTTLPSTPTGTVISAGRTFAVTSDGTKSGLIADLSNITTSLDGYYYIVVATSSKTNIQVDIDEIATDLNGKADTDLSNVPTSKGILSESYVNGTSWYRVYSDGWCVQGGYNAGTSNPSSVVFLKPFIDANYSLVGQSLNIGDYYFVLRSNKTSTGFTASVRGSNSTTTGAYSWEACGYIS